MTNIISRFESNKQRNKDEMGGKLFYKIPYGCPLEEQIQILESLN
jgi:hypothetical protein